MRKRPAWETLRVTIQFPVPRHPQLEAGAAGSEERQGTPDGKDERESAANLGFSLLLSQK
jgi:hypothetical protein